MGKHKVIVCCGTSCYLCSGNRIELLEKLVKSKFGDNVEISASACLGQCTKQYNNPKLIPPIAKIDGNVLANATNENIIKALNNIKI